MKKIFRRKRYLLAAILILWAGWIFRPYERADDSKLVPELQNLQEPLMVRTVFWTDGGSLGIFIQDSENKLVKFCFPSPVQTTDDVYQRLFSGALHYSEEGAIELNDAYHSKLKLLELLRKIENKDVHRDRAVAIISQRWRDWAVFHFRSIINGGNYYDW